MPKVLSLQLELSSTADSNKMYFNHFENCQCLLIWHKNIFYDSEIPLIGIVPENMYINSLKICTHIPVPKDIQYVHNITMYKSLKLKII